MSGTRSSRRPEIPGNLMTKWQSTTTGSGKPLARRPPTACHACRRAKVRCDGLRSCSNCTSRAIACTYPKNGSNGRPNDGTPRPIDAQESSDQRGMGDALTVSIMDMATHHQIDDMIPWDSGLGQDLDWESTDLNMNASTKGLMFPVGNGEFHPHDLHISGAEIFNPLQSPESQDPTQSMSGMSTAMISTIMDVARPSDRVPTASRCQCQAQLASLGPQIDTAMKEMVLDQIFKVTQKVVDGCHDTVNCTACGLGCTDLISMMAVLQQTEPCFRYISKADQTSAITTTLGGHAISISDPKLRAMLVMNLIQQAEMDLDAISARGQRMLQALCPSTALAQANIRYLETAIQEFRDALQSIAMVVDRTSTGPERPSLLHCQ
ncbi:hypothetical protein BCR34DRAFT_607833 [Clohesyomyces aquaticus]|uniref:Zn(2)-C6 fungal-type domain-containing protein n=1 Tax=Clohesyomyces aquaticus TaxID=1231657 RepID=A0A1Y1YCS5_9PLEO|nr:hypothetical protein BCR34DRAFT_607833 [Clohesyomyces aquaticus]